MPSDTAGAGTTRVRPLVRRKKSARCLRASAPPCEALAAEAGSSASAPNTSPSPPRITPSLRISGLCRPSREADLMRGLEALAAVVGKADLENALAAGPQREADERVIA